MSHSFALQFITGFCVGIEFYTGQDCMPGDKFAMTLQLGIVRFLYVYSYLD